MKPATASERLFVKGLVVFCVVAVAWCGYWTVTSAFAGSWYIVIHGVCLAINARTLLDILGELRQ